MALNPTSGQQDRRTPRPAARPNSPNIVLTLPLALTEDESLHLQSIVSATRRLKRGDSLYRAGDLFRSLFVVRSGSLMTTILTEDGREQTTGFPMSGEMLGLDAISLERYPSSSLALEDALIYELPFDALISTAEVLPGLQRKLLQLMSREIVKDQGVMMLLGNMNAEERLATFLVNLSRSHAARGFSPTRFQLRMRREDIGSYLGVQLETISRLLSKFQAQGLISVQVREIELLDFDRLQALVGSRMPIGLH